MDRFSQDSSIFLKSAPCQWFHLVHRPLAYALHTWPLAYTNCITRQTYILHEPWESYSGGGDGLLDSAELHYDPLGRLVSLFGEDQRRQSPGVHCQKKDTAVKTRYRAGKQSYQQGIMGPSQVPHDQVSRQGSHWVAGHLDRMQLRHSTVTIHSNSLW